MDRAVVIVAGGTGSRMKTEIPKQFLLLRGKPILMHTVERFYSFDHQIAIVLVLPQEQLLRWSELCAEHAFSIPHAITTGGNSRFESVKNGLQALENPKLVAVHDGVRPFVSTEVLQRCFITAEKHKTAIPAVPAIDSLRLIDGNTNFALDRSKVVLVQTPQVFDYQLLQAAYDQPFKSNFTDDASVVESWGYPITLCEGNVENIKITNPQDIVVAEYIVGKS